MTDLRNAWQKEAARVAATYMYHHSDPKHRSSILEHGLIPHDPYDPSYHQSRDEAPKGVYLAEDDPEDSGGHDIWQVNMEGLPTREDPDDPNHEYGFHYHPGTIKPDRLRLLHHG